MKILKKGNKLKMLTGTCDECGCKIECSLKETNIFNDNTQNGQDNRYVRCPQCYNKYLWVK